MIETKIEPRLANGGSTSIADYLHCFVDEVAADEMSGHLDVVGKIGQRRETIVDRQGKCVAKIILV